MKRIGLAFAVIGMLVPLAGAAHGQSAPYLPDVIQKPAFRASWNALFASERGVDPWIGIFTRTANGVASPVEPRNVGGRRYLYSNVCKPHDCADNMLHVLFNQDGSQAWAVLKTNGRLRWFGAPGPEQRALLQQGAGR